MLLPEEPPLDPITKHLLTTFYGACRGRRFITSMTGVFPLPLSAREISDWLDAHPSPLSRREIDEVMFVLDAICLEDEEKGEG
jgi:hypothetical protein